MIDFLDFCLIDPFRHGDFFMYFLGLLMWVCFLALGGLLLYGILTAIDSWFMPEFEGQGKIIEKEFVKAHTTTTITKVGNSSIPIMHRHPDAYYLEIEIDGRTDTHQVKKKYYNVAQVGDIVKCKYNLGRLFTSSLYINKIIKEK
jgi:hypothetical protein